MISAIASVYMPGYLNTLVYMLQSTEYQPKAYLAWYWRTNNFSTVAKRRSLDRTRAARMLLLALRLGVLLQILVAFVFVIVGIKEQATAMILAGLIIFLAYPIVWAHLVLVPLVAGRLLVTKPKERRLVARSQNTFSEHKAVKIAVAGSYGKTTMKEMLLTILGAGKNVAATPANKNVSVSHATFANGLSGDEDVLIIEYGEGQPGDVERFSRTTKPDIGVITGVAPAHLDKYKTLQAAGKDIFSLADYLNQKNVYINKESPDLEPFIKTEHIGYSSEGVDGWKVSGVKLSQNGTSFNIKKGQKELRIESGLLGRHQIGPLSVAVALADKLGLSKQEIETGAKQTIPFEHRMQPYQLNGGWVIDDTYNGNIEGIRVGLALLGELPAKRKVYVTPGLVDQGEENQRVHTELGRLIAAANPDVTILMKNSVTHWIKAGLQEGGYKGEVKVEENPLRFYENLGQFMAAGDLVLMQNDWTDNYA